MAEIWREAKDSTQQQAYMWQESTHVSCSYDTSYCSKLPRRESAPMRLQSGDNVLNNKSGTDDFYMTYNTVVCSHIRLELKAKIQRPNCNCACSQLSLISISAQLSYHTPPKPATSASR